MENIKQLKKSKAFIHSKNTNTQCIKLNRMRSLYNLDFDVYLESKSMNLQRDLVWSLEQKRELIYSMLLDRDIPPVVMLNKWVTLHNSDDDVLLVIDGKQRLTTMFGFIDNEFDIILDGKSYYYKDLEQLDFDLYRCISQYWLKANIYHEVKINEFSDDDLIELFKLINFSGTPQDSKHIKALEQ